MDTPKVGHLLLITGQEKNQQMLSTWFEEAGYSIEVTSDKTHALDIVLNNKPEVILLDLEGEGSNEDFVKAVEADEGLHVVPVILLGSSGNLLEIESLLKLGADDYLVRPFSQTLLKNQVREFQAINQRRIEERERSRQRLRDKIERDVEVARDIQLNFLPKELPKPDGWEFAAFFQPAREVAGDFYDAFPISQGRRQCFLIADVCDKGVGAALFMSLARSLTRAFAQQNYSLNLMDSLSGDAPVGRRGAPSIGVTALKNAVNLTNAYITANHIDLNYFATMFIAVLDPGSGTIHYINGGHCPPLILDAQGQIKQTLTMTGVPVGIMPDSVYTIGEAKLEPGDILFGYSDGVTDARTPKGELFKEKHLKELVQESPSESAQALLEKVRASVYDHIDTADQYDDITMIAVRRVA